MRGTSPNRWPLPWPAPMRETVPFADRTLTLGTWQQIMLLEFDTRPRRREVVVQIVGE